MRTVVLHTGLALALAAPFVSHAQTGTGPQSGASASANSFNPAISLILSGGYTRTSQDPASYGIRGFAQPMEAEIGPGTRGLALGESELGLSAAIDPWWRGVANIAFGDEGASVEEAYVANASLAPGLTLKLGRFLSGIGYLNEQHPHAWDFADAPLAYQALLGGQHGDDGAQLRWLAPTERFVELGLEVGRGRSFPASDTARNGSGSAALSLHLGDDVGASHSWRLGASLLHSRAEGLEMSLPGASGERVAGSFSGTSRTWVVDGVWKWAPEGNATRTSFKLQAEYLRSQRRGDLGLDDGQGGLASDGYRQTASGGYVQGVYQFMPAWRVGLRTERLSAGTPEAGSHSAALANALSAPTKHSLMLDYSASEFSRLRLQLAQDRSRDDGRRDSQLVLQYQMSLGAHGAHGF